MILCTNSNRLCSKSISSWYCPVTKCRNSHPEFNKDQIPQSQHLPASDTPAAQVQILLWKCVVSVPHLLPMSFPQDCNRFCLKWRHLVWTASVRDCPDCRASPKTCHFPPLTWPYQEIHPNSARSVNSVKINTFLAIMRQYTVLYSSVYFHLC